MFDFLDERQQIAYRGEVDNSRLRYCDVSDRLVLLFLIN